MDPIPLSPNRPPGEVGDESGLRALVADARLVFDAETVLALLRDAPGGFPDLDDLRHWATAERQRQSELHDAQQHGQWHRVLTVVDTAPPDYPDLARLREQGLASLRHDGRMLYLLSRAAADLAVGKTASVLVLCDSALAEGGDPGVFGPLRAKALEAMGTPATGPTRAALARDVTPRAEPVVENVVPRLTEVQTKQPPTPEQVSLGKAAASLNAATTALAAGRWRKARGALGHLEAREIAQLDAHDGERFSRLVLDIAAAAGAANDLKAVSEWGQQLVAWRSLLERAVEQLARSGRQREADELLALIGVVFPPARWFEATDKGAAAARAEEQPAGTAAEVVPSTTLLVEAPPLPPFEPLTTRQAEALSQLPPVVPKDDGLAEPGGLARARPVTRHRARLFFVVPVALLLLAVTSVEVRGEQMGSGLATLIAWVGASVTEELTAVPTATPIGTQTPSSMAVLPPTTTVAATDTATPQATYTGSPALTTLATSVPSPADTRAPSSMGTTVSGGGGPTATVQYTSTPPPSTTGTLLPAATPTGTETVTATVTATTVGSPTWTPTPVPPPTNTPAPPPTNTPVPPPTNTPVPPPTNTPVP